MLVRFPARAVLAVTVAAHMSWTLLQPSPATAASLLAPPTSTAVLGLDGADEAASVALTDALRQELSAKGRGSTVTTTLAELRLMAGCSGEDAGCIARAGQALKSDVLIFGALAARENGVRLVLTSVDSSTTRVLNRRIFDFAYDALAPTRISATAALILSIFADNVDESEAAIPVELTIEDDTNTHRHATPGQNVPPAVIVDTRRADPDPAAVAEPFESPSASKDVRAPRYPIGLAIGTVASGALAIGAGIWALQTRSKLGKDGEVYHELIEAAGASLEDSDNGNDVSPAMDGNLCVAAREDRENGGGIVNPEMAKICDRGDRLTRANHVAVGATIGLGVVAAGLATVWIIKAVKRRKTLNQAAVNFTPTLAWRPGAAHAGFQLRF